jgi:hypothetical protein
LWWITRVPPYWLAQMELALYQLARRVTIA